MNSEKVIKSLIDLKNKNSKIGSEFLSQAGPLNLSDVSRSLKPFAAIEAQIEKAIKSLTNQRSIPKSSAIK